MGWAVMVVWECEIINNTDTIVKRIKAMLEYDKTDPVSIEKYAKKLVGQTLDEAISGTILSAMNKEDKGTFGHILETCYFGINPGNSQNPDFKEAGVELKSTPLKMTKKGLVSKERLVMNMIDYMKLENETWETSSFLKKNALLLLVLYLHEKGRKSVLDYMIKAVGLWKYSAEDLKIMRDDWLKIQKMVKEGKAHELSEGDTFYLGACRKGHKEGPRKQPKSEIGAKQRAFSLKQRYVNEMINALLKREQSGIPEKIVKSVKEYSSGQTFEDFITSKFIPYYGMTQEEIACLLAIDLNKETKNANDIISRNILGVKKKNIEEFEKAGVTMRSIVLESTGKLIESISFPTFEYTELVKEKSWESSSIKAQYDKKFFFVIYKRNNKNEKVLKKAIFWNMPYKDLIEAKKVWKETILRIKADKCDNLPKITDNPVAHVRPHAQNKKDTFITPSGKKCVKKCFWLNAKYIQSQLGPI